MTKFKNKFRIESARLKEWDYSNPWWYYITINTKNHISFLEKVENGKMILNELGKIVDYEWSETKLIRKNVDLDYYVIMPNHLHGIIIINGTEVETHRVRLKEENVLNEKVHDMPRLVVKNCLRDIIRGFKSSVTKTARENGYSNFAWQTRFYDRIIRSEKELYVIRRYIEQNPIKWKLERNNSENIFDL